MLFYEKNLEPPDVWQEDCCEADDCKVECNCENHGCEDCGLNHSCRCDTAYDEWKDSEMDYDFE